MGWGWGGGRRFCGIWKMVIGRAGEWQRDMAVQQPGRRVSTNRTNAGKTITSQ